MNNFYRKKLLIFGIFLCTLILSLNIFSISVSADGDSDYDHALATTPKGLNWDNNNFVIAKFPPKPANAPATSPTGKKYSYDNNASIVQSTNPATKGTSVISLTNGTYQVGAVWSNFEKDNYFDLSHEQVASMWIYFGNTGGEAPGDGMAFVLQNDKRKENAIALSANGIPVNGQSLGVWGADWDKTNSDPANVAKTAIQNSWAMEFDTYKNQLTGANEISGEGVSFDANNAGSFPQHIATGFPALSKTYIKNSKYYNGAPVYYYTMHHDNFISIENLVDSKWHHVTIKWSPDVTTNNTLLPSGGTMTYKYDDKNPDGSIPNPTDIKETSFHLDTANFGLQSDSKLYWGFTGSTGKYYENNLMIFESIPSFVDAEATSRIRDNTQNRDIINNDSQVFPNDDISYFYNLDYKGWTKTWNDIHAKMNVPKNVHFTSGTVTYPTTGNTYQIPSDKFLNDPTSIEDILTEQLSQDSRTAIIELKGHTETIATEKLNVPIAHASFEGDNLITDTDTIPFFIQARKLTLKSDFPDIKKIGQHEDVDIPAELEYHDGTPLVNSNMIVYPSVNNKNLPSFRLSDANPASGFTLHLSNDQLPSKINIVKFYVMDNLGNKTNVITKQINVGGTVQFGTVSPQLSFKTVNLTSPNEIIPRMNNWQVEVIDNREKGSSWTVQASASKLTNPITHQNFDGALIYRDHTGKISYLNNNLTIAENSKDNDETQSKDITENWNSQDGILLISNSQNKAGNYSGEINWSLVDSLVNK